MYTSFQGRNLNLAINCFEGINKLPNRFNFSSLSIFTRDLVSFYKNNNITPVIESDFSSSEKLDSVHSFLENER